jgi:hypothetical protein
VQLLLYQHEIKVDFYYVKRNPYLDDTRNILSTVFLESSATDMLFVDDDVGSSPESVLYIAQAKRPFVAGVYPAKTEDGSIMWPIGFKSDEVHMDEDGFIDNPIVVPTGFLKLNRSVFEALDHQDYRNRSDKIWKGFFKCGPRDGYYMGEDPDLCARWLALGGKIFILPNLHFLHVGDNVWQGNYGEWLMRNHQLI